MMRSAHAYAPPASAGAIVLGYSGGGDSTFLLHRLRAQGCSVVAAIVDHGLRDGSAADAARAAAIARELGADADVLTVAWPHGPRPSQAHARDARLAALAAFARAQGVTEVHLAHTLDDQAETVMLRLAAGSTWRGLAGMAERAPLPRWPEGRGLTLVRPLLTQRRAEMRATLRATGAAWIEDPANALTRYARVRARATMEDAERWAALAARCAVLAAALDADARTCIADAARLEGEIATVSLPRLMAFPHGVQLRALSALVTAVAGASREPPEAGVARLLRSGGTLGGAWARHDGDTLKLRRDPGPLLGRGERPGLAPIALKLGKEVIWDGRLAVTAREPGWSIAVDPRGLVLRQDAHQLTLIEAKDRGLAQAEWLIGERIAHLLWR